MFRARLSSLDIAAGPESAEGGLFSWSNIPWPDLAFPTVGWALRHYHESRGRTDFPPYGNAVEGL